MKKLIIFFLLTSISCSSFGASLCAVFGITDSPQKLDCAFPNETLHLICQDGNYLLNSSPVKVAFHMEVEDGPVPLVFKTEHGTLTVLMNSKTDISAEYTDKADPVFGKCL